LKRDSFFHSWAEPGGIFGLKPDRPSPLFTPRHTIKDFDEDNFKSNQHIQNRLWKNNYDKGAPTLKATLTKDLPKNIKIIISTISNKEDHKIKYFSHTFSFSNLKEIITNSENYHIWRKKKNLKNKINTHCDPNNNKM
jgi:hypothetical protein